MFQVSSMKQTDFRHFLAAIPRLSSQQTAFLVNKLTDPCSDILAKLASDIDKHHQCVLCHSDKIKKNGKINQRQRYKCHACGKTFMCTRGSAFFYQHKSELWQDYLETMNAGDTLRSSAKKLGISLTSAFKWRHRYMASTTDEYYLSEQNHKLEGIVEADETFFRYSEKGTKQLTGSPRKRGTKASTRGINKNDWVTVLVAMDRNKHEFDSYFNRRQHRSN
jgi:transposase-like protein